MQKMVVDRLSFVLQDADTIRKKERKIHMTTQETIKKAVDYAKENNIKNIVVATTTGGNLTYLENEKDLHIVGVTNVYDQGQN